MNHIILIAGILIVNSSALFSQVHYLEYQDFRTNCNFYSDSGKILINNKKDFADYSDCIVLGNGYDKYTIIGVHGAAGGCSTPSVDITVVQDDTQRKYFIEATIVTYGPCRPCYSVKKMIYTEKFRKEYEVVFDVRKIANSTP